MREQIAEVEYAGVSPMDSQPKNKLIPLADSRGRRGRAFPPNVRLRAFQCAVLNKKCTCKRICQVQTHVCAIRNAERSHKLSSNAFSEPKCVCRRGCASDFTKGTYIILTTTPS